MTALRIEPVRARPAMGGSRRCVDKFLRSCFFVLAGWGNGQAVQTFHERDSSHGARAYFRPTQAGISGFIFFHPPGVAQVKIHGQRGKLLRLEHLETRQLLTAWTVTSVADANVAGTLRYAMSNLGSGDTISFAIPVAVGTVPTITLYSALPQITQSVTIGNSSQPVIINANNVGSTTFYVSSASNVTLQDMTVSNANTGTWTVNVEKLQQRHAAATSRWPAPRATTAATG